MASRNGEWLGKAFDLPPAGNERALFPHVLTKNIVLQVSFASGITVRTLKLSLSLLLTGVSGQTVFYSDGI